MNEILLTNIFFAITAVATVVLTIIVIILLVFIIKLIKKLNYLTQIVTDEAEKITEDIDQARSTVKNVAVANIFAFITQKIFGKK